MRWGLVLASLAVVATAGVVAQVLLYGLPQTWAVVLAAMLVGTAAAWPVASRSPGRPLPACAECGYPSWASVEMHFCVHCGSRRVWHVD